MIKKIVIFLIGTIFMFNILTIPHVPVVSVAKAEGLLQWLRGDTKEERDKEKEEKAEQARIEKEEEEARVEQARKEEEARAEQIKGEKKMRNENCGRKLSLLENRFDDATGLFNDDEKSIASLRKESINLLGECEKTPSERFINTFISKCNKHLTPLW
jgi:flagellar biosynthesis component FlhA